MKTLLLLVVLSLTPDDPTYDNGPELQERLNKGEMIEVEAGTYYMSPVVADAGFGGGLDGESSSYRRKSVSLTRFRLIGDQNARMISLGVPKDGIRSRGRGLMVRDIMFENLAGHRSENNRDGTGLYIQSGVTTIVDNCFFIGWDVGLHFEATEGTGHICSGVQHSPFSRNNVAVKIRIKGKASAFGPMFVDNCDIRGNRLGADVDSFLTNFTRNVVESNRIGGLKFGGRGIIFGNYFEHHNPENLDPAPYNLFIRSNAKMLNKDFKEENSFNNAPLIDER